MIYIYRERQRERERETRERETRGLLRESQHPDLQNFLLQVISVVWVLNQLEDMSGEKQVISKIALE